MFVQEGLIKFIFCTLDIMNRRLPSEHLIPGLHIKEYYETKLERLTKSLTNSIPTNILENFMKTSSKNIVGNGNEWRPTGLGKSINKEYNRACHYYS